MAPHALQTLGPETIPLALSDSDRRLPAWIVGANPDRSAWIRSLFYRDATLGRQHTAKLVIYLDTEDQPLDPQHLPPDTWWVDATHYPRAWGGHVNLWARSEGATFEAVDTIFHWLEASVPTLACPAWFRPWIATVLDAEPVPQLTAFLRMITDEGYRRQLINRCRIPWLQTYWDDAMATHTPVEWAHWIAEALGWITQLQEALQRPDVRRWLDASAPAATQAHQPTSPFPWAYALAQQATLVLRLPRAHLGTVGVRLVGQAVLLSLFAALAESLQAAPQCALFLNDATWVGPALLTVALPLAMRQGLQWTAAVPDFLGWDSTTQMHWFAQPLHVTAFRLTSLQAATALVTHATRHAGMPQALRAQAARLSPADLMTLPDHFAAAFWHDPTGIITPFVARRP